MGLKTHSRSKAIHIMLVYTGGCNAMVVILRL